VKKYETVTTLGQRGGDSRFSALNGKSVSSATLKFPSRYSRDGTKTGAMSGCSILFKSRYYVGLKVPHVLKSQAITHLNSKMKVKKASYLMGIDAVEAEKIAFLSYCVDLYRLTHCLMGGLPQGEKGSCAHVTLDGYIVRALWVAQI
jgi:hypothetical protein